MVFEADEVNAAPVEALAFASRPQTPNAENCKPEVVEDREHLTTFNSWGAPAARDKPGML